MYNRRKFIQHSGAAALGAMLVSNTSLAEIFKKHHPVGLQLFTFFNVMDDDVQGTLKKIADVGIKEIESAFSKKGGYYGMKPKEFAKTINDLGMKWTSHHVLGAPFKMPRAPKCQQTQMATRSKFRPCAILTIICKSSSTKQLKVELNIWYAPTHRSTHLTI